MQPALTTYNLQRNQLHTFGEGRNRILAGQGMVLAALATCVAARLVHVPGADNPFAGPSLALIALVGTALALWRNRFDLDFDNGSIVHTVGVWPLLKHTTWPLSDVSAVTLTTTEETNGWGEVQVEALLALGFADGRRVILRRYHDAVDEQIAEALSDRLRCPLQTEERQKPPRSSRALIPRLVTAALWASMVAVGAVILKPVLSGAKPVFATPAAPRSQSDYDTGSGLLWSGRYAEAESALRRGLERNPSSADIANNLAYALAGQHKMDEALSMAQKALALSPESGNILDTVAEMHERRGELAPAAQYYREALTHLRMLPPVESSETHTKLARTLVALHRRSEAIPHLEAALRYPNSQWVRTGLDLLHRIAPNHPSLSPSAPAPTEGPRPPLPGGKSY